MTRCPSKRKRKRPEEAYSCVKWCTNLLHGSSHRVRSPPPTQYTNLERSQHYAALHLRPRMSSMLLARTNTSMLLQYGREIGLTDHIAARLQINNDDLICGAVELYAIGCNKILRCSTPQTQQHLRLVTTHNVPHPSPLQSCSCSSPSLLFAPHHLHSCPPSHRATATKCKRVPSSFTTSAYSLLACAFVLSGSSTQVTPPTEKTKNRNLKS